MKIPPYAILLIIVGGITIGTVFAADNEFHHSQDTTIDGKLDIDHTGVASEWESLTIHHESNSGGGYFVQLDGNTPFVGVSGFDHPPSNRRILYLGGGGWGVDDANQILFWTDPTYTGGINYVISSFLVINFDLRI